MFGYITKSLINAFRAYITDPNSRGTSMVDNFVGDGTTTQFTLTKIPVSAISSVTVNGVEKFPLVDFDINFGSRNITGSTGTAGYIDFDDAPADTIAIIVTYKYGQTWWYPDFPRVDVTYPRGSIRQIAAPPETVGIGQAAYNLKDTQTDLFSGDGETTSFALTEGFTRIALVQTPVGSEQTQVTDFTISITSGVYYINFRTAPVTGVENISVAYYTDEDAGYVEGNRYLVAFQIDLWSLSPIQRDEMTENFANIILAKRKEFFRKINFLDIYITNIRDIPWDENNQNAQSKKWKPIYRKAVDIAIYIEVTREIADYKISEIELTEALS